MPTDVMSLLRNVILAATILAAIPASAQQPQPAPAPAPQPTELRRSGNWVAYSLRSQGAQQPQQCYVLGTPRSSEPRGVQPGTDRRGRTFIFISNRPGQNVRNEISISIGYTFRANANATVEIQAGNATRRFSLFTRGEGAWLQNAAEEATFVTELRRGRELRVRGTSQRGTATTDVYALDGISQVLDSIQNCR